MTAPGRVSAVLSWVLLIGGAVGTVASLALVLDRIALLEDPSFVPSCSIDEVVSCGSILSSAQAEAFGFPNPLIGLACFPVVATLGVVTLAGVELPRWIRWGLQVGSTLGLVFVVWLMTQSLYVIGALCPYCTAVWAVTITVFFYATLDVLASGRAGASRAVRVATTYHGALLLVALLAVAGMVVARFWLPGG